ncbi:hypothetical protein [Streptomyces omiyaensis]|uniref:DUF3592 domain-containing protein n=1 Tax=Streptomyces omiyaensis TaxID=68247 RepID=A0ABW7C412_9ACTN|nr:hypothetical protein [Streptomyces omiyaensis]GGY82124.1 hypothetical protein GCM10010363_73600 [Streptomyces omiyaensis]
MSHTPDPAVPEPAGEEEPWLSVRAVTALWPVRKDWVPSVAHLADVRVRRSGGESRGTYGAAPTIYHFHPEDVRRAAQDITEGRVDIPTVYRTDTPDGRRAEFWNRLLFRVLGTILLAMTAASILGILFVIGFVLTVE